MELQQAVVKKGSQFFCKKRLFEAKSMNNLQSFSVQWQIGSTATSMRYLPVIEMYFIAYITLGNEKALESILLMPYNNDMSSLNLKDTYHIYITSAFDGRNDLATMTHNLCKTMLLTADVECSSLLVDGNIYSESTPTVNQDFISSSITGI
jgi:hypothetical protein